MTTFVNPTCATAHNLIFFVFFPTQQQDHGIKPRGVKVKEKEIHGSDRLIGGFEKATQMKNKTKNDTKASGSAMEADIGCASSFEKAT